MATLFINHWNSKCGACGRDCDPYEKSHLTNLGYSEEIRKQPGCGAVYTEVSSDYMGMKERVRAMRPDLDWVGWEER